jgi:hypothetical protein
VSNPIGINGTDVVLLINGIQIPAQRGATQSETVAVIDMSSKDSPAMRVAPGRYTSKLSLTALYVPGASGYDAIQAAFRQRDYIDVIRKELGSSIETASAIISEMSPQFPDSAASVITLNLEVDDTWSSVP